MDYVVLAVAGGLIGCLAFGGRVRAGGVDGAVAAGWYRVTSPVETTTTVRFHDWRGLLRGPETRNEPLAVVRQAMDAERLDRLTGAYDLRSPDTVPVLQWAAREATAAADAESRRRDPDRGDGGLLDGWISDFVDRQEQQASRAERGEAFTDWFSEDRRERGWGWLADDVYQRERRGFVGGGHGFGRSRMDDPYEDETVSIETVMPLPGWNPAGVGRIHGGDPDGGRGTAFPGWQPPNR